MRRRDKRGGQVLVVDVAATYIIAATIKLANLLLNKCYLKSPCLRILTTLIAAATMAVTPCLLGKLTKLRASLPRSAAWAHCLGPSVIVILLRNPCSLVPSTSLVTRDPQGKVPSGACWFSVIGTEKQNVSAEPGGVVGKGNLAVSPLKISSLITPNLIAIAT
jgi:hypothetical protein